MDIALFGNPNTGKTSLFNHITGSYEYVGNWSGVTVEKKVGRIKQTNRSLIDLPGVYSLNPLSKDERVASLALLENEAEQILNIVNADQLERSLYLTTELMETGRPLVVVLNMVDLAKRHRVTINLERLSNRLGVKVFTTVARKGDGCQDLIDFLKNEPTNHPSSFSLDYGEVIESAIREMESVMAQKGDTPRRWMLVQYLNDNGMICDLLDEKFPELRGIRQKADEVLRETTGKRIDDVIYETKMAYIRDVIADTCVLTKEKEVFKFTAFIDRIVTHRILGIPIFLLLLFLVFQLTFDWLGTPMSDLLDQWLSGPVTDGIQKALDAMGAVPLIKAVILNGIIAGVGGVLVFVPQIFILFFFISLLEDSGYMARVAVVMDRLMEFIGLNGKAFIPLVIGFGCNVPAVMAARTIEQPKERLLTILITPFMSCSARLSVYALFVAAFFERHQALIVLSLYVLGIVVAILIAKLFSFFLKNEKSYFIMDLPPYNVPQLKSLLRSTWDKGKGFVRKAGTFIFGGTVFIWVLSYFGPSGMDVPIDKSFMAIVSSVFAPLFAPLGFASWQAVSALITGFLAKEVVVSTMNVLYFVPKGVTLSGLLPHYFSPLAAYSFLVFVLLYTPCLSTVAAIKKETGRSKIALFSIAYSFIAAYIIAYVVYILGRWIF